MSKTSVVLRVGGLHSPIHTSYPETGVRCQGYVCTRGNDTDKIDSKVRITLKDLNGRGYYRPVPMGLMTKELVSTKVTNQKSW